jgi:hypothetical protein
MRKAKTLLFLGIWVAVLPYLGFPHFYKSILFSVSGLGLIYFSYTLYKEYKKVEAARTFDTFSENRDFNEI